MTRPIRIDDIRLAGHCVLGTKGWFEAHDLDFKAFLRDGIDAETFAGTGDSMAIDIVLTVQQTSDSDAPTVIRTEE